MKIDLDEIVLDLLSKPGAGSYRFVRAVDVCSCSWIDENLCDVIRRASY